MVALNLQLFQNQFLQDLFELFNVSDIDELTQRMDIIGSDKNFIKSDFLLRHLFAYICSTNPKEKKHIQQSINNLQIQKIIPCDEINTPINIHSCCLVRIFSLQGIINFVSESSKFQESFSEDGVLEYERDLSDLEELLKLITPENKKIWVANADDFVTKTSADEYMQTLGLFHYINLDHNIYDTKFILFRITFDPEHGTLYKPSVLNDTQIGWWPGFDDWGKTINAGIYCIGLSIQHNQGVREGLYLHKSGKLSSDGNDLCLNYLETHKKYVIDWEKYIGDRIDDVNDFCQ